MSKSKAKIVELGNSLAVLWLGLYDSTAEGMGSISVWGTKISYALLCGPPPQKKKAHSGVMGVQCFHCSDKKKMQKR